MPKYIEASNANSDDFLPWLDSLKGTDIWPEYQNITFEVTKVIWRPKGYVLEVQDVFAFFVFHNSKEGMAITKWIDGLKRESARANAIYCLVGEVYPKLFCLGFGDGKLERCTYARSANKVGHFIYNLTPDVHEIN